MNKYMFFLIIFTCGLFVRCANSDMSSGPESGDCLPDVADKYEYPVMPGTTEWNSASMDEKLALIQLPDEKLESLSSHALIRSLLDMPSLAMNYMLSSNSSPIGTCNRFVFSQHNSVAEFEKRKDRVDALISYYETVGFGCYHSLDEKDQMSFPVQLYVLQIWFTRDAILHSLDKAQKKRVVSLLLQKYRQQSDVMGALSVGEGALTAMAWIMYDDQYAPVVSHYGTVSSNEYFTAGNVDDVIAFAKNYTR